MEHMLMLRLASRKDCLNSTLNAPYTKIDCIKIKNFYPSLRAIIKRMERQATDWWKVFEIHISNTGIIFRIYKEFLPIRTASGKMSDWVDMSQKGNPGSQ